MIVAAPIPLKPVDAVQVTTLVDNCSDALLPDEGLVRRWGLAGSAGPLPVIPVGMARDSRSIDVLRAEHGFSVMVETYDAGRARRLLFDAGVTPDGLVGNLDRLAIAPDTFEVVVLSHGHFDHVMGLDGLGRRLGRRNLPLVLHPDCWTRRRLVGRGEVLELPTASRSAVADAGFTVVEERQPSFLLDGRLLVTGEVDRTTDFETGMPVTHEAWRGDRWQPDRVVHDDQAIVLHVRDRGLVVLTGCGHAGVVNIVRHALRLTGVTPLYAVLGGLHLRDGPAIPRTVEMIAGYDPRVVVPAHCTSWKAQQALAAGLPDAFRANSVGSRFEL